MAGWILDRGIIHPAHRGLFFGCRNAQGQLEGVGLIGRTTMFEARSTRAAAALGEAARRFGTIKVVFAEPESLNAFWNSYADQTTQPRLKCRESLYESRNPVCPEGETSNLRLATIDELDPIVSAHAEMVKEETGIDPLLEDREGFRERCATRIKDNRVWISMERGELVFKADIVTETPQVVYFEGVWVNPAFRGQRLGHCFMAALTGAILSEGRYACFFANQENEAASRLYCLLGCELVSSYIKYLC